MNQTAKNWWISKLQKIDMKCVGQLHKEGSAFSAIGALCLAYRNFTLDGEFLRDGRFEDAKGNVRRTAAPTDVLRWAELLEAGPGIRFGEREEDTIIGVNDGLGRWTEEPLDHIAETVDSEF